MRLAVDLHIHSALSPCADNDMTPNNIVGMSIINELDAIAITDHNSAQNAEACIEAAKGTGLIVIPGMEIETSEEIHVVTLFPNLEAVYSMQDIIYKNLPPIKNKKDIFGSQLIIDNNDEIIGEAEQLLMVATFLSLDEVVGEVRKLGGAAIPAHVDRTSFSVLSNLGYIPDELHFKYIELSKSCDTLEFYQMNQAIMNNYRYVLSSDAHYLEDLNVTENYINPIDKSIEAIVNYLT